MSKRRADVGSDPWYRRQAKGWQALRNLPSRSLLQLYLAVFCIFSAFGFYLNLMTPHRLPLLLTVLLGVINGAYCVLYPWVLIRFRVFWVWVVAPAQILWSSGVSWWASVTDFSRVPGPKTSLIVTAQCIWILLIVSYVFFVAFIRNQATSAIRMQNELELAHGIQQTLVPVIERNGTLYEIYGVTRPSERVGGDLVDVIHTRDGDVAYVADVAGHGLQAGILMGMLKAAAHTALLEPTSSPDRLPQLLQRLDCVLPAVKETHMYAALVALQLGPMGQVRHTLAGHPPVLHYASATGAFRPLGTQQLPLGLLPGAQFSDGETQIAHGDLLLVATDGILEACDGDDREFGSAGVESCVSAQPSAPLPQIAGLIFQAVSTWGKQEDDQTLLLVRCIKHA